VVGDPIEPVKENAPLPAASPIPPAASPIPPAASPIPPAASPSPIPPAASVPVAPARRLRTSRHDPEAVAPAAYSVPLAPTRSIKDRIIDVFENDRETGRELVDALITYGRAEAEDDARSREHLHELEIRELRAKIALEDAIAKHEMQLAAAQRELVENAQPRVTEVVSNAAQPFQMLRYVLGAGMLCIVAGIGLAWAAAPAVATQLAIASGGLCLAVASVGSVPAERRIGTEIATIWEGMAKFVRAGGEAMSGSAAPSRKRIEVPGTGNSDQGRTDEDQEAEDERLAEEETAEQLRRERRLR
jgi:hypothetical protein